MFRPQYRRRLLHAAVPDVAVQAVRPATADLLLGTNWGLAHSTLPAAPHRGQASNLVPPRSGQAFGQARVRSVLGTTSTRRCAVHNDEVHPADVSPPVRRSLESPSGTVLTVVLQ